MKVENSEISLPPSPSPPPSPTRESPPLPPKRERCPICRKSLGIDKMYGLQCTYCEHWYCIVHRCPHSHECERMDLVRERHRQKLVIQNPVVNNRIPERI